MKQTRKLDSKAVRSIMAKRSIVIKNQVGKRVVLTVQGEGSVIDVKDKSGNYVRSLNDDGTIFQKKIVNFRANSQIAMANERNRQLLNDGIKAEKAGDAQKAHELFGAYLNATQLSMSVPLPSSKADQCTSGTELAGRVVLIQTENGELLTIDPSSISIVEPERLGTTSFQLPGDEDIDEAEEELTTAAQLESMDRDSLKSLITAKGIDVKITKSMKDDDIRNAIYKALNGHVFSSVEEEF